VAKGFICNKGGYLWQRIFCGDGIYLW